MSVSIALCLLLAGAQGARARQPEGAWQRVSVAAGGERAEALAFDPGSGRLAVGGERGVLCGRPEAPLLRVLDRGPVRDLHFLDDGGLLVATGVGLFHVAPDARVRALSLDAGEAARDVTRLDALGEEVVAATAAGVYRTRRAGLVSGRNERRAVALSGWQRVQALPAGEVGGLRLARDAASRLQLWVWLDGALWRVRLDTEADARAGPARDASGRGAVRAGGSAALRESSPRVLERAADGTLWALTRHTLLRHRGGDEWERQRLTLPPGAQPRALAVTQESLWLASDAGLLAAPSASAAFRRAAPPAGHVAVSAIVATGDTLWVATAHGLLQRARPPQSGAIGDASALASPAGVAPRRALGTHSRVAALQRAALRHLELEPVRMHRLARDVLRRAWWPELRVGLDYARDRDAGVDRDQTFSSGATRHLVDRDRSRGEDWGASLQLSWDLGDRVFSSERIDVSREARLVLQLRDDVLDEVTQLYFERERVLAALASPAADTPTAEFRLRAEELAANLDAWTGGWFSAQLRAGGRFDASAGLQSFSASERPALPAEAHDLEP